MFRQFKLSNLYSVCKVHPHICFPHEFPVLITIVKARCAELTSWSNLLCSGRDRLDTFINQYTTLLKKQPHKPSNLNITARLGTTSNKHYCQPPRIDQIKKTDCETSASHHLAFVKSQYFKFVLCSLI